MSKRILGFTVLCLLALTGTVYAVRPSGPGINTKANSLSVAIATDQPAVPTTPGANMLYPVGGGSAADITALCKDGFFVANADAGTLWVLPAAADAGAVSLTGLANAQTVPVALAKVLDGGGTTASVVCMSH